eukprot:scaffold401721_cov19-Prasinocladus_malaysianus.AAC.1
MDDHYCHACGNQLSQAIVVLAKKEHDRQLGHTCHIRRRQSPLLQVPPLILLEMMSATAYDWLYITLHKVATNRHCGDVYNLPAEMTLTAIDLS